MGVLLNLINTGVCTCAGDVQGPVFLMFLKNKYIISAKIQGDNNIVMILSFI